MQFLGIGGNNTKITGSFSTIDTVVAAPVGDGTLVSGSSTAGSVVSMPVLDAMGSWVALIKNYATGTVYSEASLNSTNGTDGDWVEVKGSKGGTAPGIENVGYAFTSSGYYKGNTSGFIYFRLRYLGVFTAGLTVTILTSTSVGATALISGLLGSNNIIGKVGIDQTTDGTTNAIRLLPETTKIIGTVNVAGTVPVSGSFFQTTQPVSIAAMPTTPVTGAFFQTTQPISATALPLPTGAAQDGTDITTPTAMPAGGVGIRGWLSSIWTKLNGSLAVTGTFFQATQPVSIAATVPVSGTFFQATQPVSLATNTPDVIDRAARLLGVLSTGANTIGAVNINGTVPVSLATNTPILAAGSNIVGKVGIDQTTQGVTNAVSVTSQPELVTTGTITTTDIVVPAPSGAGALLSGTPTAGSYVSALAIGGNASVVIGITGLTTGTIYYEGSADSTTGIDGNWVALNMKQAGYINTQISSSATTNGLFRGNTAGIRYIRMRSVGALTGTPFITLRLSAGVAGEFLFGSIPTGTNSIGFVTANEGAAITTGVTILQNATAATSNGTSLVVTGYGTAVLKITGTFVATINFEFSTDGGATWDPIAATQIGAGDIFTSTTIIGSFRITCTALDLIRARVTLTSGTITINGRASNAINASKIVKLGTGTNSIGIVTQQIITKNAQGTNGVTTQDLKDAGRNQVHYYTLIPVLTSATDTLQSLTGTKASTTVTATATPAVVTTAKTFRVTRLAATYIATAVSGYGIVRLRFQTAGVVTITSPIAATLLVGAGAPTTANSTASEEATLDEGWEFAAGTGVGISVQGFAAVTATAVGYVLVSVTGYEY